MQRDLIGTLVAISGWACIGTIITNDYWKTSTVAGSIVTANTVYENLWTSCATDSMGVNNCRDFDSLLNLPGFIQACRALVITAIILGFFASLLAFLGMQCTSLLTIELRIKAKITFAGGVIYIVEGLSALVAVSWYATQVVHEFFDPLFPGTKYELGEALYVGWAGSALCVSGGIILCTVCFTTARASPDSLPKYVAVGPPATDAPVANPNPALAPAAQPGPAMPPASVPTVGAPAPAFAPAPAAGLGGAGGGPAVPTMMTGAAGLPMMAGQQYQQQQQQQYQQQMQQVNWELQQQQMYDYGGVPMAPGGGSMERRLSSLRRGSQAERFTNKPRRYSTSEAYLPGIVEDVGMVPYGATRLHRSDSDAENNTKYVRRGYV